MKYASARQLASSLMDRIQMLEEGLTTRAFADEGTHKYFSKEMYQLLDITTDLYDYISERR